MLLYIMPLLFCLSIVLFQELFRLVDFGRQVWAPSTIWMIEQHQLSVIFPDLVFRDASSFTMTLLSVLRLAITTGFSHFNDSISEASLLFILGSNPPL